MRIFLDSIGCRLNQAEIETLAHQFRLAGHEIVASADEADLAVVNTCTVTAEAAADSRSAIRKAGRLGAGEVVVTGCWSTLEPGKAAALQKVSKIVPNLEKDNLASELLDLPAELFDLEPLARQPLPGIHRRTRAFIKVQDGCDNACTFCITTVARGASRSRPVAQVLSDVHAALEGGAKEIVLTGVHLGSWGQDFLPPQRLTALIKTLLEQTGVPRLRLSSLEPWDLDKTFFSLWKDPRLCRHLHLPLQSGSATVLRRMRRKTIPASFAGLVEEARRIIPEVAITTDLITGFPGESEKEFNQTMDFVRSMQFAGGHVFTYSSRPGTPAARMKDPVGHETAKHRSNALRGLLAESARAYHQSFIGRNVSVLWESTDQLGNKGWQMEGLTDTYLRVGANSPKPRWNEMDEVKLTGLNDQGGLNGVIQSARPR